MSTQFMPIVKPTDYRETLLTPNTNQKRFVVGRLNPELKDRKLLVAFHRALINRINLDFDCVRYGISYTLEDIRTYVCDNIRPKIAVHGRSRLLVPYQLDYFYNGVKAFCVIDTTQQGELYDQPTNYMHYSEILRLSQVREFIAYILDVQKIVSYHPDDSFATIISSVETNKQFYSNEKVALLDRLRDECVNVCKRHGISFEAWYQLEYFKRNPLEPEHNGLPVGDIAVEPTTAYYLATWFSRNNMTAGESHAYLSKWRIDYALDPNEPYLSFEPYCLFFPDGSKIHVQDWIEGTPVYSYGFGKLPQQPTATEARAIMDEFRQLNEAHRTIESYSIVHDPEIMPVIDLYANQIDFSTPTTTGHIYYRLSGKVVVVLRYLVESSDDLGEQLEFIVCAIVEKATGNPEIMILDNANLLD